MPKSFGFTLIELLIAITITGVLTSVIISSAASIQRSTRDTQRKSDLLKIQAAMEHYYADYSGYATSSSTLVNPSNGAKYLKSFPTDPNGSSYGFEPKPAGCDNSLTPCITYCLYSILESSPSSSVPSATGTCTNTAYNFYITQP